MQDGGYPQKKKKSVAGQFARPILSIGLETYCWTQKLNREDYGVDKYWVLLAKTINTVCTHLTNLAD